MTTPSSLPRTWRPYYVRIVAIPVGFVLVIGGLGMWVALPAQERALFSGVQAWTLAAILVALLGGLYGLARTRATAEEGGVVIVNVFRRRRLEWAQILAVNLRPGDPWVYLDIDDGTTLAVMGIQAADGARARVAAGELRAIVANRTATDRDD